MAVPARSTRSLETFAGLIPDFHLRDLSESVKAGKFLTWTLFVQVTPHKHGARYRFNPFGVTKVKPHEDYLLVRVGTMTLDQNPGEPSRLGRTSRVRRVKLRPRHRHIPQQNAGRSDLAGLTDPHKRPPRTGWS